MSGRAFAHGLVDEIGKKHGFIRQEILDRMSEEDRREVEYAMLMKDQLIASSVTTLARNLYTSNARFVFELLQNAEDNHYTKARARNEVRQVSFGLHRDRVVVECNEDGFTPENLTAICNVGKSSKTGAQGYIGEKGIGFKSVFMAAYRAHIQSVDFSFYFQHRNGDSGMGMITPVWAEDAEHLGDRLTRITLLLHEDGTPGEVARRHQVIRKQFEEIHDTILLFMKNLEQINITFNDNEASGPYTIQYSIDRETDTKVKTTKTTVKDGEIKKDSKYFHCTKHIATGLGKNENRTYSESEEASRAYSRGEVILAFPLTANSVPVLKNQPIFAFLPVREMAFKFLIQADFVTQANRQDIVTTSVRNEGLAKGIAEAFIKGVLQLCEHDTLQYQWMRYLPSQSDYPWGSFWISVINKIENLVKSTAVLVPASRGRLKLIMNSRRHGDYELDRFGRPLFPDTAPELYPSLKYKSQDLALLEPYGLKRLSMEEIIVRVKHDNDSPSSRLKTTEDLDWHTRASKLLYMPWKHNNLAYLQAEVKSLVLVPCRDGSWVSTKSVSVFYPTVDGTNLEIPRDLDLKVADPTAVTNAARKQLFDYVGVQTATVSLIRNTILKKYQEEEDEASITPQSAACHLRFLYLTEHLAQKPYNYHRINLRPRDGEFTDPDDLYLYDKSDPYGVANLLSPTSSAPGFDVLYVHDCYFEDTPAPPTASAQPWKDWFLANWHVRIHPRLDDRSEWEISGECTYIANSRPEKYVGMLQRIWEAQSNEWNSTNLEKMTGEFAEVEVLCKGDDVEMQPLKDTYLPTKHLEEVCNRFIRKDEFFPWLKLEGDPSFDAFPREWDALGRSFGLGYKLSEVEFALVILEHILNANIRACNVVDPSRIYELYIHLQTKIRESSDPSGSQEKILDAFTNWYHIYIPDSDSIDAIWAYPSNCVWEAPMELTKKHSLSLIYQRAFPNFDRDRSHFHAFFSSTLEIPDCTWRDLVEELKSLRAHSQRNNATDLDKESAHNTANKIYECLRDMKLIAISASELKNVFETDPLVYGHDSTGNSSWYTTTKCLWSGVTQIRGMLTLNELYANLKDFFVQTLKVQKMTGKIVYDKLSSGLDMSVQEARETLFAFSSFLQNEGHELDPRPVLAKPVFPVKLPSGPIQLLKGTDEFSLVDRKTLGDDFAGKAKLLHFSMEEIREFQPFIEWARLGHRYLSKSVKEISSVDVDSTRPITFPARDVKRKAYALLRIAVHFKSPRARENRVSFYELLKAAETLETDKITSVLQLNQEGEQPLQVEKETATLHISDRPAGLKIYVPRNRRSQEICFNSKLPQCLCEWLMTDPTTQTRDSIPAEVTNVVQSILGAKNYALADILDEHGIITVDIPDESATDDDAEDDLESDAGGRAENPGVSNARPQTPPTIRLDSYSSDSTDVGQETPLSSAYSPGSIRATPSERGSYASAGSRFAGAPRPPMPRMAMYQEYGREGEHVSPPRRYLMPGLGPDHVPEREDLDTTLLSRPLTPQLERHEAQEQEDRYTALLHKVVTDARRAAFPSRGAFDMSDIQAALDDDGSEEDPEEPYRLRSTSQIERDKRVGAAGELFVFELLSHLESSLPGFSRANWQSTIRNYVTRHPEYADIASWNGRETADIMYNDDTGAFTDFLVDKGYLDPEVWAGAKLKYFFEIKTTTGTCRTPFFMSNHQYSRMQVQSNNNNTQSRQTDGLYVVFRVYNLGKDSVGVKVLVDPESLRQRGELAFTARTWSVVTGG
ncbi:hypothetical protein B0H63DRAFT_489977 [Podospora didyma]|uniref:Protein NO VEIN C-terminal domain-containing protein n=1 Tax=Podospora didyma TaxID=330526 RepID=A0AAE0N2K6_9PEZI|nr:hypothetical protein B0H63DRAFT_489977 [Podospora didyma]